MMNIVNMTNSNRILKERLSEAEYEKMVAQKERDVYKQMLSYMFRFDSKIGKLLYPVSSKDSDKDESKAKVLKLRRDSSIVLKTVPFVIPAYSEEDSFESFAKEMEQAEIGFIGNILER